MSRMVVRPAGYSSEEDEDSDYFCDDQDKERKRNEIAPVYGNQEQESVINFLSLAFAIVSGNIEIVKTFLDAQNIDINIPIRNKRNALQLAASSLQVEILKELVARGGDVNVSEDDVSALMLACENTSCPESVLQVVSYLVENGANVKTVNRKCKTVFMQACAQGILKVVQYLFPFSDLEAQDITGWTALFYAVRGNKPEIVEYLLKLNANFNHLDIKRKDVSYYAKQTSSIDIIKLLPQCQKELLNADDPRLTDSQMVMLKLLGAMKCRILSNLFLKNNINLRTFLTLSVEQLKNLGVRTRRQRVLIVRGLHEFHAVPWTKNSLHIFVREPMFSTHHARQILYDASRQLEIMDGTVRFLHTFRKPEPSTSKLLYFHTQRALEKIEATNYITNLLLDKAEQIDNRETGDRIWKGMPQAVPLKIRIATAFSTIFNLYLSIWY